MQDSPIQAIRRVDDATVVELRGEINLHRSPIVHETLLEESEKRPARLVIDLHDVPHLDSSGLGTLVDVMRRVKAYGGQMALVGLTPRVRDVFEITRLDQFFAIYPSVAEALKP